MDLLLNDVLNLTQQEIENSKIEFNVQAGSGGQSFLDRWLKHTETDSSHCITTFLHGIYYPNDDCFTHIDCAKNQYAIADYLKKYSEEDANITIDLYTEKDLHYKIWCIENGKYSTKTWYELMIFSLTKKYQILLNEMLE